MVLNTASTQEDWFLIAYGCPRRHGQFHIPITMRGYPQSTERASCDGPGWLRVGGFHSRRPPSLSGMSGVSGAFDESLRLPTSNSAWCHPYQAEFQSLFPIGRVRPVGRSVIISLPSIEVDRVVTVSWRILTGFFCDAWLCRLHVCIRVVRVIRRQGNEPIFSHELLYHPGVGVTLNNRCPVSGFCCATSAVRGYQEPQKLQWEQSYTMTDVGCIPHLHFFFLECGRCRTVARSWHEHKQWKIILYKD